MSQNKKTELENCTNLFEFSSFKDLFNILDRLKELAISENWAYKDIRPNQKNINTPVLENYIHHTFRRLIQEYKEAASQDEKQNIIYHDDKLACFNTGLFTPNYNMIYALFYPNTSQYFSQPYFCFGFVEAFR